MQDEKLVIYALSFAGGPIPSRTKCRRLVEQTLRGHLSASKKPKLVFDSYGKPTLENFEHIAFSYAHSQTQLVIVVHPSARAVGVDTESLSRLEDLYEIRDIAFSATEGKDLSGNGYAVAWCRKEAAVKQLGKGFRDADPSDVIVKTSNQSYTLCVGNDEVQKGYYFDIILGNDVVVICADKPVNDFLLFRCDLKDIRIKE